MSAPRIESPGYQAVHLRLQTDRGLAKEHPCTGCGERAQEWAYDHLDEEERVDPKGRPYSLKAEHYMPMCIPCHRTFDSQDKCRKGHEFTPVNTYWYRGYRLCRECRRSATRALRERRSSG